MSKALAALFKPLKVGTIEISQRIAFSPCTRCRAEVNGLPNDRMVTYYEQRASTPGTLLVTEATFITERAGGFKYVPGIWSKEQIAAWQKVTSAVHNKKSSIFMQLWAPGRQSSHVTLKELGHDYISSSPLRDETDAQAPLSGYQNTETPRALTIPEIKEYVADYAQAAKNAVEAGFDGVEIHAGNGYLIEQFIRLSANNRTDEYGGSIPNRARFVLEVVDAITAAIGPERTAIRLTPFEVYGGVVAGPETIPMYSYILHELELRAQKSKPLAYVHTVETVFNKTAADGTPFVLHPMEFVRYIWSGIWMRTQGFEKESAEEYTNKDDKLIIGFGRHFISNPDLVRRLKEDLPLNNYDWSTFYSHVDEGYIDYPFYDETK